MDKPCVEFYFEFASPYSYLSSEIIEGLCARHGVEVEWKPFLLGPILQRTGSRPLFVDGRRGDYAQMDCRRWARLEGIPFHHWGEVPANSLQAARGALYLEGRPSRVPFIHACFRAHFVEGRALDHEAVLGGIVRELGEDETAFFAGIGEPALKTRLRDETEQAWARGVFGAPTFFYGGEMFWGNDRLPQLERWIQDGAVG